MRIAVISDIHANVLALRAVLADIKNIGVDRLFNLGDILYGPLWPRETFELLQKTDAVTIQGNQDRDIYDATPAELPERPILRFTVQNLGADGIAWLSALPKTMAIGDIFLCHGTPESDMIYLLEDVASGEPRLREDAEIQSLIGRCRAPVVVCGHTHIPRAVRLASGQTVLNPGSVGLPAYEDELPTPHRMQSRSPDASYAIIEKIDAGWVVAHRRVPYEFAAAVKRAHELGSAGANQWAGWLATGRVSDKEPSALCT
jgi:putative phosphoesterase